MPARVNAPSVALTMTGFDICPDVARLDVCATAPMPPVVALSDRPELESPSGGKDEGRAGNSFFLTGREPLRRRAEAHSDAEAGRERAPSENWAGRAASFGEPLVERGRHRLMTTAVIGFTQIWKSGRRGLRSERLSSGHANAMTASDLGPSVIDAAITFGLLRAHEYGCRGSRRSRLRRTAERGIVALAIEVELSRSRPRRS